MGALNGRRPPPLGHRKMALIELRKLAQAALLFVLLITCSVGQAQNAEQHIKAAFLYHFCSYVQWPDRDTSTDHADITIGVAGNLKTIRVMKDVLENKAHKKCTFHVRRIKPEDDLSNIQMLYIARTSRLSLNDFDALAKHPPILTITDQAKPSAKSIINFVILEDQVRFAISKSLADQAGLKLSSELLAVAIQVD